jgi:amidase
LELSDYTAHDATGLSELIAARSISPAEVLDAARRAIEAVEPALNAVLDGPLADPVEAAADGPLLGVPFAAKDTLSEAGRPLGFGSRLLDGFRATRDSTLAERFRDAGLVTVVRTATPEFAFNTDTAPVLHGPTRNPWNLERSPGGSSGGSAALVAARALPMAHANDGGGSIRVPAAWCGLVGLKPSRGRVPLGPAVGEAVSGLAHEFALTRTVRDAAALLDAVNGPSPGDRYYVARPHRAYVDVLREELPPLRIALHTGSYFGSPTAPAARTAVERAGAILEGLGHHVEEASPEVARDALLHSTETIWAVDLANLARAFARLTRREPGPALLEAASWACVRRGRELSALELESAASYVNAMSRRWGRFMDEHDLYICPTTPGPAPPSGVPDQADPRFDSARAWVEEIFDRIPFTPIANVTGQPAISIPLGEDPEGMPLGVMLTAQTLRDDLLLRVAGILEEANPWSDRRPPLTAASPG